MKKGTGKLRQDNNQKVLQYFINYKEATKKEIADFYHLSVMTVGTILNTFLKEQIIYEKEMMFQKKGRPTQKYSLHPHYYHLLILYIMEKDNQYEIFCQVKDALSQLVKEKRLIQEKLNLDKVIKEIKKIINRDSYIQYIGIGIPASVSEDKIIESDIQELKNIPDKSVLESQLGVKISVFNDMKCSAYGYYIHHPYHQNICFLTFPKNSGPGCGSMINGRLLEGKNTIAGEIVYLPVFHFLEKRSFHYTINDLAQAVSSLSAILNPDLVLLTGERINQKDTLCIEKECLKYIPQKFMPEIKYIKDYRLYYLKGIEKKLIDQIIEA